MKQYLLFAGTETNKTGGLHGFAGDFDTVAEAFLSLVDQQTASEWWHVLDTKTGEVYERRHIRMNNGMIGFQRSDWVVGTPAKKVPIAAPTPAPVVAPTAAKVAELSELEIGLRSVVANGVKASNGAAAEH
jgi:endonuclease IV